MSKINPEPNLIHIMGCYVLGNPNGEKVRRSTLWLEGVHLWSVLTVCSEPPLWDQDALHPWQRSFIHLTECNDMCSPGMDSLPLFRSNEFSLKSVCERCRMQRVSQQNVAGLGLNMNQQT